MTSETNERFVEKFDASGESGNVADPNIVHRDASGKGKRAKEYAAREGHATTEVEIAHQEVVPAPFVETDVCKEGGRSDVEGIVCDMAVAHHTVGAGFERCDHALHLALEPKIVLVGEKYILSARLTECVFEIVDGRSRAGALHNANNRAVEGAHHIECAVGRTIVGDDHFILGTQLGEDGTHLLMDCGGTVVGGKAN